MSSIFAKMRTLSKQKLAKKGVENSLLEQRNRIYSRVPFYSRAPVYFSIPLKSARLFEGARQIEEIRYILKVALVWRKTVGYLTRLFSVAIAQNFVSEGGGD